MLTPHAGHRSRRVVVVVVCTLLSHLADALLSVPVALYNVVNSSVLFARAFDCVCFGPQVVIAHGARCIPDSSVPMATGASCVVLPGLCAAQLGLIPSVNLQM
jgi:hypothetical protein